MIACFRYIEAVAGTGAPILITGETGVGKELVARAIHDVSRPGAPFVALNAAGLDDHTFSDTLFGHRRGAFTGADTPRNGLVREADSGTLFLDESGALPPASQVKLLRLLQEHEYFPLGSDIPQLSDARIVASSNRDLADLVRSGDFRPDLYYRFRTHEVRIPPLRERKEDLPVLLAHFLATSAERLGTKAPTPPDSLIPLLATYDFPGNVRELEAMVFDAVTNHRGGVLSMKIFLEAIEGGRPGAPRPLSTASDAATPFSEMRVIPTLKESADLLVTEALRRSSGNQSLAARLLGITPSALNQRIKKQGLQQ